MRSLFDRFIAVDWSGAAQRGYSGIAVAECRQGTDAPILVQPPRGRWRRTDFVAWLISQANSSSRLIVGIDCAFALPAIVGDQILGESYSASDLWEHIDRVCSDDSDYYGGGFVEAPESASFFWGAGARPAKFVEYFRATEIACKAGRHGTPQSVFKLIGAAQVGKSSLAGMRVLNALKQRMKADFSVWPFDPIDAASVVCVEIYPRLFLQKAGHGSAKAGPNDINLCLAELGSSSFEQTGNLTGDETDALVAAAGLRMIARDEDVWNPPGLDALARRAEGWIFGVP